MLSQFFIERPKFAMVISILTMLAGFICIGKMPISEYPEVAPPTVRVSATYRGASAQELTDVVAPLIEQQVIGIDDLEYFYSSSNNDGSYALSLIFKPGSNGNMALINTSNAIKRVEPKLPTEITQTGLDVRLRSADLLCSINFLIDETKNDMSTLELSNFIKMNIKDALTQLDGVSGCDLRPPKEYAMRIWLDIHKMSAMGIAPSEIETAIREQNNQAAVGSIGSGDEQSIATYKITIDGRLKTAKEFENIIVRKDGEGRITKLKDIARVELGSENMTGYSRYNGEDAVALMVFSATGANALETIDRIKTKLSELEASFPPGVSWETGYDPTLSIAATMKEIVITLFIALGMVVLITFIFLQDWRATIIPTIAIPVSLLGALVVIYALGFSINVLTMFGLILVIGSLVDDAIVVVENVMRLIHDEGLSPHDATVKGMKQITGAIVATTLVTIAVYVPIAFYGGMVGTIYTQFSVTMCVALLFSTFNALTLSPALCALILRPAHARANLSSRLHLFSPFNWCLELSRKIYLRGSGILIRRALLTLLLLGGVLYLNYDLFSKTKTSFIPSEDKGIIFVMVETSSDSTSKLRTNESVLDIEQRIMQIPGVAAVSSSVGYNMMTGNGENKGMCIVRLKHWDERTTPNLAITTIQKKIQDSLQEVPAAKTMVTIPPAIRGLGMTGGVSAVLKISGRGASPSLLAEGLDDLCKRLEERRDITLSAKNTFNADTPIVHLNIDREKALSMNISVGKIFSSLSSKLASSYVNDFTLNGFSFKVMAQALPFERQNPQQILSLNVRNDEGHMVPLSSFCTISYERGTQTINRFDQIMSADISAQTVPGVGSGDMMNLISDLTDKMNEDPRWKEADVRWEMAWKDLSFEERKNQGQIVYLFGLSLLFAYFFLVAQYESWTTPISVMLSVSVATLGALLGIMIMGLTLSIYVQLGLLMLIGLSSKNAILIVEFAKKEHELHGVPIHVAAKEGASKRFRAVLMTAISFIFGVFPLVIAEGSGAMSRHEIGITTFAGMILATCLGIFLVPALYALIARMSDFFTKTKKNANEESLK